MKWLLLVACFFLVACSSTTKNSYVRASGEGNTFEEAKTFIRLASRAIAGRGDAKEDMVKKWLIGSCTA